MGVGTPEGSLIPLSGAGGTTAFVKDGSGQVVKSKLDEKRLREIAEATGGNYLHLAGGPATMKQLYEQGLAKMQAGDIQDRVFAAADRALSMAVGRGVARARGVAAHA